MSTTITSVSDDKWLIRAERERAGQSASGQVVVTQSGPPDAGDSPHVPFAGARAWLDLTRQRLAAGEVEGAIADARAGLEELGQHYKSASTNVKDDTSLHIAVAEDLIEQGRKDEAARRLLQTLEIRLQLFSQLYADAIAD
jgi:hypothetical protein